MNPNAQVFVPKYQKEAFKKTVKKDVNKQVKKVFKQAIKPITQNQLRKAKAKARTVKKEIKPYLEKSLEKFIQSVADPFNTSIRWPDKFNAKKTALANPIGRLDVNYGENQYTDATTALGFIFRDSILRAAIILDANPNDNSYSYWCQGIGMGTETEITDESPSSTWSEFFNSNDTEVSAWRPMQIPYAQAQSQYQPHGLNLYSGSVKNYEECSFFWVDALATVTVVADAPTHTFGLNAWYWNGAKVDKSQNIKQLSSGVQTTQLLSTSDGHPPGYYCFAISTTAAQTILITSIIISGTKSVMCHLAASGLEDVISSIGNHRVNGASLMYSNRSAQLYKEGDVIAQQLVAGTYWIQLLKQSDMYAYLLSIPDASPETAVLGRYIYNKPLREDDFKMKSEFYAEAGVIYASSYKIDSDSPPAAILARIDDTTGQAGFFTWCQGMEFFSESQYFERKIATAPTILADKTIDKLKRMPQSFTNVAHPQEIWEKIKGVLSGVRNFVSSNLPKAINFAKEYGPKVIGMAETAMPYLL